MIWDALVINAKKDSQKAPSRIDEKPFTRKNKMLFSN